MDWTICRKSEDIPRDYQSSAVREALWWFFERNGIGGNSSKVYNFLKQFLWTEAILGDYGRLFFTAHGNGLELQKFDARYGMHDDHSDVTSIYLVCASDKGMPCADWPIEVNEDTAWMPLENDSAFYRKEWFDGCGDVKVFFEERTVMGSYYARVTSPVFFITDIPGASGFFLLKVTSLSD